MTILHYELCGADTAKVFSPHCWKTRMALEHKGVDYTTVPVPFTEVAAVEGGEGRRVPVIRDGDHVVEDSYQIALYLEEAYPDAPTLFGGEGGKALTQFCIAFAQMQFNSVVSRMALMNIYDILAPADQAHFRTTREKMFGQSLESWAHAMAATKDDLVASMKPLEMMLKSQPYIGGDSPLFADYVLFGPLQWLRVVKGDDALPQEGAAADWLNRLLDMYGGMARSTPLAA
ncbi:MAG: glutathione S-transferase family protein [Pseudomonadota bacterium]